MKRRAPRFKRISIFIIYVYLFFLISNCGVKPDSLADLSQVRPAEKLPYFAVFLGFNSCATHGTLPSEKILGSEQFAPMIKAMAKSLNALRFTLSCFEFLGSLHAIHGIYKDQQLFVEDSETYGYDPTTIDEPLGPGLKKFFQKVALLIGQNSSSKTSILGMSWGGWTSIQFAQFLSAKGQSIDKLISIDPISKVLCKYETVIPASILPLPHCKQFPPDLLLHKPFIADIILKTKIWHNYFQKQQKVLHSSALIAQPGLFSPQDEIIFYQGAQNTRQIINAESLAKVINIEIKGYLAGAHGPINIDHAQMVYIDHIWQQFLQLP